MRHILRAPARRVDYRIAGSREGLRIDLPEAFWDESLDAKGRSTLDTAIDTLLTEIRAALYYIACADTDRH